MKKLLFILFLIVMAISVNAQVPRPMEMQKQNMKVISPAAQISVRNDLGALQMQSAQLCDSVAVLQQRISESVKELQAQGTSNEQAKAMVLQQYSDRINKMMAMLSNILKKMSETSSSIIGNLK